MSKSHDLPLGNHTSVKHTIFRITSVESEVLAANSQPYLQLFVVSQIPLTTLNYMESQYKKTLYEMISTYHSFFTQLFYQYPHYHDKEDNDRG